MSVVAVLLALVGLAVLAIALFDLVVTTVAVSAGKGPVTSQVARAVWKIVLAVARGSGSRKPITAGGPAVLFFVIGTWIVLLIVGWSAVLAAGGAVVDAAGNRAGVGATFSFVATSLVGGTADDVRLAAGSWQYVRPFLIGSGFVLLSLVIAYIIPVVNATVAKRKVAGYISTLGHEPSEILRRTWNGEDLADLHLHLNSLAPMVLDMAEKHLAYPVLHYMDSQERHTALSASAATLDETLTVLETMDGDVGVPDSSLLPARRAVSELLDTLRAAFVEPGDEPVPPPASADLREIGLPLPDRGHPVRRVRAPADTTTAAARLPATHGLAVGRPRRWTTCRPRTCPQPCTHSPRSRNVMSPVQIPCTAARWAASGGVVRFGVEWTMGQVGPARAVPTWTGTLRIERDGHGQRHHRPDPAGPRRGAGTVRAAGHRLRGGT